METPAGRLLAQLPDQRMQRFSAVLAWTLLILSVSLPLAALFTAINADAQALMKAAGLSGEGLRQAQQTPLSPARRWLLGVLGLIPVVVLSVGLLQLRGTFLQFAKGSYFSPQAIAGLRRFTLMIGLVGLTEIMLTPLQSVLLTLDNGAGQKQLVIAISSSQCMAVVVALCVWVVAWVMGHAASLQEENRQFV
jgi:Protein of unknown function (DUF2975)